MNSHKTISEYKSLAKEQLLGNYGMAIGSFVVIFVMVYMLSAVLMGATAAGNPMFIAQMTGESASATTPMNIIKDEAMTMFLNLVVGAFTALLTVGYLRILACMYSNEQANMSDIFFGFKNHPDKVLIMYAVIAIIQYILLLPARFVGYKAIDAKGNINGPMFFAWIVLYVVAFGIYIYISIVYAMRYLVYIYNPEKSVKECFDESKVLMRGNKLRYAYMMLSLIGYWLLGVISLGLGILWVEAYSNMLVINMYNDAKNNSDVEVV